MRLVTYDTGGAFVTRPPLLPPVMGGSIVSRRLTVRRDGLSEHLAHGALFLFLWWCSVLTSSSTTLERAIAGLVRDCSVHYVLPKTSLTPLLSQGKLSVQQVSYAYVAWKFAFHFLNRDTAEIRSLQDALGGAGGAAYEKLVRAAPWRTASARGPHCCGWCGWGSVVVEWYGLHRGVPPVQGSLTAVGGVGGLVR